MNKLGIGYNCFGDSIELLESSVKSIRGVADYVVVIYQDISNWGNKSPVNQLPILQNLKEKGLIDNYIFYQPRFSNFYKKNDAHKNEVEKRNIALKDCLKNNCSHFMSMDNDEFYKKDELLMVKNFMFKNHSYQSCACLMQNYYKEPIYQMLDLAEFYVSLINKIDNKSEFKLKTQFPAKKFFEKKLFSFFKNISYPKLLVDPTRRLKNAYNVKIFTRQEIEMHHMTFVRNNLSLKLNNSSAKKAFQNIEKEILENHKNFNINKSDMKTVKIVENIFNIQL